MGGLGWKCCWGDAPARFREVTRIIVQVQAVVNLEPGGPLWCATESPATSANFAPTKGAPKPVKLRLTHYDRIS